MPFNWQHPLDVGLDPTQDPRTKDFGWPPNLVCEEMLLECGLNPDEMSEEAYLKARRQYVAGTLSSLEEMVEKAKQYQQEYDARDLAITEWLAEEDDL